MYSFKNFILNEDYSITPISREDTFSFIFNNCQQWFEEIYGKSFKTQKEMVENIKENRFHLYRGLRNRNFSLIETASNNRYPKDTSIWIHNSVIKTMKELGFNVHRGNCLFCTNKKQQARVYSVDIEPFLVFPIDGYEYVYSEKIKDLYGTLLSINNLLTMNKLFPNIELLKKYIDFDDDVVYELSMLDDLVKNIPTEVLSKIFDIDKEYFQKEYKFKNTDIKNIIFQTKKGIEIMFRPKLFLTQWIPLF